MRFINFGCEGENAMNQVATQVRESYQRMLYTLKDTAIAPADKMKTMIVMLDLIQQRLTLLEGATLHSLEGISNE